MGTLPTDARHKILLVDDDQDFLEVYWETLKRLPCAPEIHTASTGARALALLESEPFSLLIVDLHMPKMDGLQVLAIARRKFPHLRIVVLTGVSDEEFRARAYGMGVDQFWQKPVTDNDVKLFLESIESLLQREQQGGFRGVQSKSLVDIIQLESMSQTSGVLRITNGVLEGRIWLQAGAVIDAAAQDLAGEDAFRRILAWKTGSFEMLPPDPARERKILTSCNALLLESAQAMDEASGDKAAAVSPPGEPAAAVSPLAELARLPEVQFLLSVGTEPNYEVDSWGLESPEVVADWTQKTLRSFETLGERLQVGHLQQVAGLGKPGHVVMAGSPRGLLTAGFRPGLGTDGVRETMKMLLAKWAS